MQRVVMRRYWLVTLLLIAGLVIAACVPAAPAPATGGEAGGEAAAEGGQKVLRFYTSNGDHAIAANEYMIEKFKESHPDFTVEIEYGGDDYAD
ncbi:MAG TPA: hypothetical protein VNK95_05415, partial [Caldilineaceae bacterium]|nr:hypothetical protein [Caldilineaceae bacterium]